MRKDLAWPMGLFITIGGTILFFLWLIPFSATKTDALVSDTYYQEGISYQETINRLERTVNDKKSLVVFTKDQVIYLQVVADRISSIEGTVLLRRPNDTSLDKKVPLSFSPKGEQSIAVLPGVWNMTATWNEENKDYQQNEKVIVTYE